MQIRSLTHQLGGLSSHCGGRRAARSDVLGSTCVRVLASDDLDFCHVKSST